MANGQAVAGAPAGVVVVAADADRREQYEAALRKARIPTHATLDVDEAEALVSDLNPDVLVLDRGLPRLVLFRLYGLVREGVSETRVQVVFVGQDGDTGPGDHYLPGDPSPSNVADRVTLLIASASAAAAAMPPAQTATVQDASIPAGQHAEPARPAARAAAASPADTAGTADTAQPETASPVPPPETDGVVVEPETAAAAEDPPKPGRRLDVILIRVGLVLLVLGVVLILIQSDAYPPSLTAPGSAPATPTRPPAEGPKPGAVLDGSGLVDPVLASRR